ncbi:MAG: ribosome maturation factor RimM [OM182 bacterium MED-G24]|uniref:Ribosome maturation factor RimM n=1 Tax=OM182 bacterium MED-G24 TaxID=1986255 RepID=A0A2A5WHR0_9GAMM|nr:MAG: ribosome maturation factor RimM [OM182 bacterium MED-G24]
MPRLRLHRSSKLMVPLPDLTGEVRFVVVGRLGGAYGIKGWIRLTSYTDPPEQIMKYQPWQLVRNKPGRSKGASSQIVVEAVQHQNNGLIAKLKGIDDRNEAEQWTGVDIEIEVGLLPVLDDEEVYWHQLEAMKVVNKSGECLGEVDHMMDTGAHDVLVVRPSEQSIDGRDRMIPYVKEKILGVDLVSRIVQVDWAVDY